MNHIYLSVYFAIIFAKSEQITISGQCKCQQLQTEADCQRASNCQWNGMEKKCSNSQIERITINYCSSFTQSYNCIEQPPCAWNGKVCTHFTACSAYSPKQCNQISKRCISDGLRCAEIDLCTTYKTKISCIKDKHEKYCYWNGYNCEDLKQCSQLPIYLNSDALCRQQIAYCTAGQAGGCVESGEECWDQASEVGCIQNKARTSQCFWDGMLCKEKTCDNAPAIFVTDAACRSFQFFCTTKFGGGCIIRKLCSDAQIAAACVNDYTGRECFWYGNHCDIKSCQSAKYKTNALCQEFNSICITNGKNCVEIGDCEVAIIKEACDRSITGQKCHWDEDQCKLKTCENAGNKFKGHDQCTSYMGSCTENGASGCTNRACENAPIINNTNELCQTYLPTGNCITKNGGGCKTNNTCESIDIDIACITDANGKTCFWDGTCKYKICTNSPLYYNSHQLCQQFLPTCTVGSGGTCVDMICENIQTDTECTKDLFNKPCIYKARCYSKYCAFASKFITTHDDCQAYLSTCTLDNSGIGCVDLPLKCEAITNSSACKIKSGGGKCGLQGTSCVDQSCSTAPADGTLTTNTLCNLYKTGCVVNNNADGCMDLPTTCSLRKQKDVCEYEQGSVSLTDKCEWNDQTAPASQICIDIKCENAHLVSLKASVTQVGCWGYNSLKCVITTTGSVSTCIPRPKTCSGLVQNACDQSGVVYVDKDTNKNCFWDEGSSSCKDIACASITTSSSYIHDFCNGKINTCTVNAAVGTACIALKSCHQYYFAEQCRIDADGNDCKWTGVACIDKPCPNADDSSSYDSDTNCQNFSNLCTLTQKKCTVKKFACADYKNQAACEMNTIGGTQQCEWAGDACADSTSTFDCTKVIGIGLTVGYCQKLNATCSVNATGTACIVAEINCSAYYYDANCKWARTDQYCAYINSTCVKDCSSAIGPYDFEKCQAFSSICTVKLNGTGCVNIVGTCADTISSNCTNSYESLCYMVSGVCTSSINALLSSNCDTVTGAGLTATYCKGISGDSCSVNSTQTMCIVMQGNCGRYAFPNDCFYSIIDGYCFWSAVRSCIGKSLVQCTDYYGNSFASCQQKKSSCTWRYFDTTCSVDCFAAPGPKFDLTYCQSYDLSCTVKLDGSGCVSMVTDCASTTVTNCTKSYEGLCYPTATSSCQVATIALTTCSDISSKVRLTADYCKGISANSCSVLADQTGCVYKQNTCAGYATPFTGCFSAINEPKCVMNTVGDTCMPFDEVTDACTQIKIIGLIIYTDYHCKLFKSTCKANNAVTGCEDELISPTCASFTGTQLTYYQCVDKKNTCSVNASKSACTDVQNTCSSYSQANCGFSTDEGECYWTGNGCAQKTCDGASVTITDMNGCLTYSSNCVLRAGGCQARATCASYLIQGACIKNSTGGDCLWNPKIDQCVDKVCSAAEASTYYDTHDKCSAIGKCTVKANADKSVGQGCIARTACSNYVNYEQCKINDKGNYCVWNTNDYENLVCADKSCATAPISIMTHEQCQQYLEGCTVNIVDVNGTSTPQGCVLFKSCSKYLDQAQCYISSENDACGNRIICGWNGIKCADKSCATAQNTVNTPTACVNYFSGCTVNSTNDGCIAIPDKCEGMTINQCYNGSFDSSERECYWLDDITGCVTKTCENSPIYFTNEECNTYLNNCTADTVKCKTMMCEDFPFQTDPLCKAVFQSGVCTTNGITCVLRGTCDQAQAEAGCITDSYGKLCQWIKPDNQTAYCIVRTCTTAPSTLTTEEQCKQYYTPTIGSCTTKKDGGCTLKGACFAANIEDACKTDNTGADCWWDTDKCRLKECKDFYGSTHVSCQSKRTNCTAGLNGKCALMANCEATPVRAACIFGNNGPCLWINDFINVDGSKGACFKYDSCKSLAWTTDAKCKLISPNCTTDGEQCIGITSCAETNITGGCKTGIDGQCIQTVSAKGANEIACKLFYSCDAAFYLTHDECYAANPNCTSDYTNGCISLAACSTYSKLEQCQYNKDGVIKDFNNQIASTGNCVWDATENACRDEQCKDITLTTEQECSVRLKTCSTDGTTCIVKGACNTYTTNNACNKAGGTEGTCFWVAAVDSVPASCRNKTCADIPNGFSTAACPGVTNCVSNGTNCISKTTCSKYTTKTSCMSSGTDGLCVWADAVAPATQGKCELMTGCSSAKDETTCIQAQNRCSWNSTRQICGEHTCETYNAYFGSCKYFYTWDLKNYNVCHTSEGQCVTTDAINLLQEDCYILTAYQYHWSPNLQKCIQCGIDVPSTNNSNDTVNSTNATITSSGYILSFVSAVLAYHIF